MSPARAATALRLSHSAALGDKCRVAKLTLAFSKTVIAPIPEEPREPQHRATSSVGSGGCGIACVPQDYRNSVGKDLAHRALQSGVIAPLVPLRMCVC